MKEEFQFLQPLCINGIQYMSLAPSEKLCGAPEPQPPVTEKKYSGPWSNCSDIKTCEGRPHTFWVYRTEDPSPACDTVLKVGLTPVEKKTILDLHNNLRHKVAEGKETRGKSGPQPPARYMQIMEWDDELTDLAQRWANQCSNVKDQCRDVKRFKVNQLWTTRTVNGDAMTLKVEDLVLVWYKQVDKIDTSIISNYTKVPGQNSYTQMVWADTHKIGCGAIRYTVPTGQRLYLVCNYGPGGNIEGQPVYKIF